MKHKISRIFSFIIFISFGLGVIIGFFLPWFSFFYFLATFSLLLTYYFYKKGNIIVSDLFIIIFFVFLGSIWVIASAQRIDNVLADKNKFSLKVISLPKENKLNNTFFGQVNKIDNFPVNIKVKVIDYSKTMEYFNMYTVEGKLRKLTYGQSAGFYYLWVKADATISPALASKVDMVNRSTNRMLLDTFKKNCSDQTYRFLASVFLGKRELLSREENTIFKNAGITHLLAISGSNIALAAVVVFFLLQLFNVKYRPRLIIAVFFLYFYNFVVGYNAPTLRATIMYSIIGLGFLLKRKVNILNCLGLAGIILLVIEPLSLFDAAFQLSFISVFALIIGFKLLPLNLVKVKVLDVATFIGRVDNWIKISAGNLYNSIQYTFFASLFVTLLITPLISYYFGRVYILSIFHNIILIPFFALILTINFIFIIFSAIPFLARPLGVVLSCIVDYFTKLSYFLGAIKFTFVEYTFSILALMIYYCLLGVILTITIKSRNAKLIILYKEGR